MKKRKFRALSEIDSPPISISDSDNDSDHDTDDFSENEGSSRWDDYDAAVSLQSKKLDTTMFEHYLEIMQKSFRKDTEISFSFIDSLWFSVYMQNPNRQRVLEWIKQKHILSKTYVVVPIVCWGHWNLLILCHLGLRKDSKTRTRCMLLLDSLHMAEPRKLEPDIRRFVDDIYEVENNPDKKALFSRTPLLVPKVPQQTNGKHCGIYVLYFVNLFVHSAPKNFHAGDGYPYFMKEDWFCQEDVDRFCRQIGQCNMGSC